MKETRSGLDPWKRGELPAPPDTRGLGLLAVIGPGAIVLGASIGSGEWLIGPATLIRHGMALLWVTLLAVFFQTILNTEVVRYTLYTGEPAFTGFMRTRPSSTFWACVYSALFFFQTGWPGWAGAAAGAVFFLAEGRAAGPGDAAAVHRIAAASFVACVAILVFGGRRIERTLEILNWVMVLFIFSALGLLCLRFASGRDWLGALLGFGGFDLRLGRFNPFPEGADWFLVSAFAAYSGCGGVINLTLSNWARDKGYGMGQVVGFIPTAVGGRKVRLAHTGTVFEPDATSLPRFGGWWRIVKYDQWGIFFCGALLGMALPGILYTSVIEPGRDIRGLAVATELSNAMAARGSAALPLLLALVSVWIMFKTQLDVVEGLVRAITDILWSGSKRLRTWGGGDVRVVYYSLLVAVVAWGLIALSLTQPIILLQLGANVAGIAMAISSIHILRVNTTLLPEPLRPARWRRVALVGMSVFYSFFIYLWLMGGVVPNPEKGFLFNIPRYVSAGATAAPR
jgi:Mn2+/Fe2+ NRAMP family transporter